MAKKLSQLELMDKVMVRVKKYKLDKPDLRMMLTVAVQSNNLNVEKMLKFDRFNFVHDITGIYRTVEPSGTLRNFFWPRCGSV